MWNNLILIKPTIDFEKEIVSYRQSFNDSPNGIEGTTMLSEFDSVNGWLTSLKLYENENTLPNRDHVASYQYLLINKNDKKIIGMSSLRLQLNDFLFHYGGHIGYSISPEERKQGKGTILLAKMLLEAKKIGINKVLVTCNDDNIGSAKIIEANNGRLEDISVDTDSNQRVRRYWIENN